jgi:hypothetical protein
MRQKGYGSSPRSVRAVLAQPIALTPVIAKDLAGSRDAEAHATNLPRCTMFAGSPA